MFDFSQLDTVKKSEEGVYFSFLNMDGDEIDGGKSGAVMYGPDSPAFKRAHSEAKSKFVKANSKKSKTDEFDDLEDDEKLEKVIACCVRLVECKIGDKIYSDNRDDIREFFTKIPVLRDQMWARITKRSNFLPNADKA